MRLAESSKVLLVKWVSKLNKFTNLVGAEIYRRLHHQQIYEKSTTQTI